MRSAENLRTQLYNAMDRGEKEEILRLSRELDAVIVKEMKKININNSSHPKGIAVNN